MVFSLRVRNFDKFSVSFVNAMTLVKNILNVFAFSQLSIAVLSTSFRSKMARKYFSLLDEKVCVCVCVCFCVCTSIQREGFICLDHLDYRGIYQRCCDGDVYSLCQVPSSLLQNEVSNLSNQPLHPVHTMKAGKVTTYPVCLAQTMVPSANIIRHRLGSALHRKPFYLWRLHSREGSQSNQEKLK